MFMDYRTIVDLSTDRMQRMHKEAAIYRRLQSAPGEGPSLLARVRLWLRPEPAQPVVMTAEQQVKISVEALLPELTTQEIVGILEKRAMYRRIAQGNSLNDIEGLAEHKLQPS